MRILTITGSRSDRNAIEVVHGALDSAGHDVRYISVEAPARGWSSAAVAGEAITRVAENVALWHADRVPDLAFVHGDRHEVVGAALGANILGIPVAHIGGGDVTTGSQDDKFRRAITALSHLHFVSTAEAAQRVVQMGEAPEDVHVVGCPGIDFLLKQDLLSWYVLWSRPGFEGLPQEPFALVLLHPSTIDPRNTLLEATAISLALKKLDLFSVLVGPNADTGWEVIDREWELFAATRKQKAVYRRSLEPAVFLSLLKHCAVLVGNSSAAYYEAPYFGKPAVDVGLRQNGRHRPKNVAWCPVADLDDLADHIDESWAKVFAVDDYYGDGRACERIVKVVSQLPSPATKLLGKGFNDLRQFHHGRFVQL